MAMEFWGAEVKSGQTLSVQPGEDMGLHVTQASLGVAKKEQGSEHVYLFVNIDGKKLVLGTLNRDNLPQQQFDLLFDKDIELSHSWEGGSVYFLGYKSPLAIEYEEGSTDEEYEDLKPATKVSEADKASAKVSASDKKVTIEEPSKDANADDEDDSDEDDTSEDKDSSDGEENESDSDEQDEEPEKTPDKVKPSKKRSADSAAKTPAPDKKAKFVTPQKTDGKKGAVHVDTPHPAKQAGKTPGNKPNQTPKAGGFYTCKPCNRTFGSETALESHTKAKHSAGK